MSDLRKRQFFILLKNTQTLLRKRKEKKRRETVRQTLEFARKRLKIFSKIQSIPSEEKRNILSRVIHFEAKLARYDTAIHNAERIIIMTFSISIVTVMMSIAFVINHWYRLGYRWFILLGLSYFSIFLALLLVLIIIKPLEYISSRNPIVVIAKILWVFLGLSAYAVAINAVIENFETQVVPWYILLTGSSLSGVFAFFGGISLVLLIRFGVRRNLSSKLLDRFPDALLTDSFLKVIVMLEKPHGSWNALYVREEIMKELEIAAKIVNNKFAPALETSDLYHDAWLKGRLESIAAAIRSKKSWVCMPKKDTRERLLEIISSSLIAVAYGQFDSLLIEKPHRNNRKEIMLRGRLFIMGVLTAFLPTGVYYFSQSLGFIPKEHLKEYLDFGVILWAVISLLFAVDPRFRDKLDALNNATSLIPGASKKKEK